MNRSNLRILVERRCVVKKNLGTHLFATIHHGKLVSSNGGNR